MTAAPAGTPPAAPDPGRRNLRAAAALLVLLGLILWALPGRDALGRPLPLSLLLGAGFGLVLQRGRFCFWCNLNDYLASRDARGLLAILVALAAGTLGHAAVLQGWVPDPFAGRLPPDAHVGPVGLPLVVGAFSFGLGMALSGSCISAHLYRLGEGSLGSVLVLAMALAGFALGFLAWNPLYLALGGAGPVIWLPALVGHGGALCLALLALAGLAALVLRFGHLPGQPAASPAAALFRDRWPPVVTGLLVGLVGVIAYLRVGPLGVTAELGSLARTGAAAAGWLPDRLVGLDGLRGCATVVKETLLSRNGVFVTGLVLAAAASAQAAGQWRPALPAASSLPRLLLGGLLLGFGAMLALGCTVGILLSGTMAGAAAGWVFGAVCLVGALCGRAMRRGA